MEVVLRAVSLIPVGVLPSTEVIASVVSSVIPSGWCPIPIDVHWNGGVVHPSRSIGRVVLRCILPLGTGVVPWGTLLLRSESSEVSVPTKYISE